jgi:hypothetical protein
MNIQKFGCAVMLLSGFLALLTLIQKWPQFAGKIPCLSLPTTKIIEDQTDQWSSLVEIWGMKIPF